MAGLHFTIKQLRYVEATARTGSIANAAHELAISQSSVTSAIDLLEERLGFDVFLRMPSKGVRLTPSGKEVLTLVTGFLNETRQLENELQSMRGRPSGSLRLACYAPTATHVLPQVLKKLTTRYPSIRIELMEGDMAEVIALMDEGKVDVAMTYRQTLRDRQRFTPLFRARPYALLPRDNPLTTQSVVTLPQLCELPMILLDLYATREYFTSLFTKRGLDPRIVHSTKSSEIARTLVAGGFGFTILNICGDYDRSPEAGYVPRPISDDVEEPAFGIAHPGGENPPRVVQAFINACITLSEKGAFDKVLVRPD